MLSQNDQKLIQSFKTKQPILAKTFLSIGVSPNLIDPITQEPLIHQSIISRQLPFLKLFLDFKWDPNQPNKHQVYPIQLAIQQSDLPAFQLLLQQQASLSVLDQFGDTLLHLASFLSSKTPQTYLNIAKILLEHHQSAFSKNLRGETPLHRAARYGSHHIVHLLSNQKQNFQSQVITPCNLQDLDGFTPVHSICYGSVIESNLETLLSCGANPNIQDRSGQTPLHLIAVKSKIQNSDLHAIKILKEHQADLSITNYQNLTPYHLAYNNFQTNKDIPLDLLKLLKS